MDDSSEHDSHALVRYSASAAGALERFIPRKGRALVRRYVPHAIRVERVRLKRYPQWIAEADDVATTKLSPRERASASDDLPAFHQMVAMRQSPLRREGTSGDTLEQRGKEINVRRACELLDGIVIAPGQLFSYHHVVGRPSRLRGFVAGPEMHDAELVTGVGGGCCQVANMLYQLALLANFDIVERHRHGLDLYPDDHRTVPFGCGATVFYNQLDLRFRNTHTAPICLEFIVHHGVVYGRVLCSEDNNMARVEVYEKNHAFFEAPRIDAIIRKNEIWRRTIHTDGRVEERRASSNRARINYEIDAAQLGAKTASFAGVLRSHNGRWPVERSLYRRLLT